MTEHSKSKNYIITKYLQAMLRASGLFLSVLLKMLLILAQIKILGYFPKLPLCKLNKDLNTVIHW